MDHLIDHYQQDFDDSIETAKRSIQEIVAAQDDESKSVAMQRAEVALTEAEEIVQQIEFSAMSTNKMDKLRPKIEEYQLRVKVTRQSLNSTSQGYNERANRDKLFSGGSIPSLEDEDVRQRMHSDTRRLQGSSAVLHGALEEAQGLTTQMEDTMVELNRQRDTMMRSDQRLDTLQDRLKSANRIIGYMTRRVMTNKLIMAVIILVLIAAIGIIIYVKYVPRSAPNPEETP